jgi:hypothetical protein
MKLSSILGFHNLKCQDSSTQDCRIAEMRNVNCISINLWSRPMDIWVSTSGLPKRSRVILC